MNEAIPLACPEIAPEDIQAVLAVLEGDRLSIGPRIEAFEQAIAARAGRRFGIGVNSGTSGLHLCVRGLGIGPGDEVITTPFSFVATTNCILFENARPVFVDIDPQTYNLNPDAIEAAITPRTKAILPVEVFGNTTHFDRYEQIARKHGLKLIEDCCEALGGTLHNRPTGSFGDCGVFGFYPNKQITCAEGGVIVTDDADLAAVCRSMRNQGRGENGSPYFERLGYNYRLSELSAALGDSQLRRLDDVLRKRQAVAALYNEALRDLPLLNLPPCQGPGHSWFVYVIRLAERFSRDDRDTLVRRLGERGIGCQTYFQPIHLQPHIQKALGTQRGDMPACEQISDRTIALPFFNHMTPEQVRRVADEVRDELARLAPTAVAVPAPPEADTDRRVPFFRVTCEGNEFRYVSEVLSSGWLTTAGKAADFEKRFAAAVGGQYACAVNSCTAALHLAVEALGVKPGDRVFVPTMTFTASAEVIRYMGAEPLLLDVEYGSSLLTPAVLEQAIHDHPDVKVLVLVHFAGQAADMLGRHGPGILDLCRKHGVRIVEDAAHAFPCRIGDRMVGSFGDVTCFSFYANKTITTGEGGMLVTHDKAIAERASVMRLHGIDRSIWDRFTATKAKWEYDVIAPGYKYNMPDVNAAIGLAQLERAYDLFENRLRCAEYYFHHLADVPFLDLPLCHGPRNEHSWHIFSLVLHEDAPIGRNELIDRLGDRGIGSSVHYKPLHRMTYYKERYKLQASQFPQAERIWRGCFSLPLYPSMTEGDLAYVCQNLRDILTRKA